MTEFRPLTHSTLEFEFEENHVQRQEELGKYLLQHKRI